MRAAHAGLCAERRAWWEAGTMWHLDPFVPDIAGAPRVKHPLVHRQPFTGDQCLYLGGGKGRSVPEGLEEGSQVEHEAAWEALLEEALAAGEVYDHVWEEGDLVIWDNTQVLHRGNPYDKS